MPIDAITAGRLRARDQRPGDAAGTRSRAAEKPSPGGPLIIAGLCVVALALVWVVAELVPAAHVRDAALLGDFARVESTPARWLSTHLIHLLEPLLFVLWGIALVALALARGRPRVAAAVVAVMAIAPFSAELLKPLLAHPHDAAGPNLIGPASLPSGHATAATALALSVVLVMPQRLRPFVSVLAAAFAGAVGVALLIQHAHMPSDVVAGWIVGSFWMATAVAALRASERRWPARRTSALT